MGQSYYLTSHKSLRLLVCLICQAKSHQISDDGQTWLHITRTTLFDIVYQYKISFDNVILIFFNSFNQKKLRQSGFRWCVMARNWIHVHSSPTDHSFSGLAPYTVKKVISMGQYPRRVKYSSLEDWGNYNQTLLEIPSYLDSVCEYVCGRRL